MSDRELPPDRSGALPIARRRAVYAFAGLVWLTGTGWLVFKYFVRVTDPFGFENPHPLMGVWMIAHAFAGLSAVWLLGVLWRGHIVTGWVHALRRGSGGTLFALSVWLALTGCALYYIGNAALREAVSLSHWVPGIAALAAFWIHRRGRG